LQHLTYNFQIHEDGPDANTDKLPELGLDVTYNALPSKTKTTSLEEVEKEKLAAAELHRPE
jgi:hypothetical protein